MIRILRTVLAIAANNSGITWAYLQVSQPNAPMLPWETSSVLRIMPHNQHADIVVLGTSHARSLTGCRASADVLQNRLQAHVINLAKNIAGPVPQRLYFDEFYARNNSADLVIYFADPWAFYSAKWNEEHGFLVDEPLEPRLFVRCLAAGSSPKRLFKNARGGFTNPTFKQHLAEINDCNTTLDHTDPTFIRHRINHIYGGPVDRATLQRYADELNEICVTANEHGARIIIATPPTLLGPLPGMNDFVTDMLAVAKKHNAHYFNFADCMNDPVYFIDHDHLNANGVAHFTERYLRPAIDVTNEAAGNRIMAGLHPKTR